MRTNIDIDDRLMAEAMQAGGFRTKKDAVEAGLQLLRRQAAVRELLKLEGKLPWGWGDEDRLNGQPNWSYSEPAPAVSSPPSPPNLLPAKTGKPMKAAVETTAKSVEARRDRR